VAVAGPAPAGDDAAACLDAEGRRAFSGLRAPVWQGRRIVFDKMTLHHWYMLKTRLPAAAPRLLFER